MDIRVAFIFVFVGPCIFATAHAPTILDSPDAVNRFRTRLKTELAKNYLKSRAADNGLPKVDVTARKIWERNVTNSKRLGSIFRHDQQSYIFNGLQMLQLKTDAAAKSAESRYSLSIVSHVGVDEGVVLFKKTEWRKLLFLVVCYMSRYCQVLVSTSTSAEQVEVKQTIDTSTTPVDVNFFVDNDELLLIIVKDPTSLYRWTGTYFDKHDELETAGAQGVGVLNTGDGSVIVLAQNLGRSKVYSKVLVRNNGRLELIQLLPTNKALQVLPFSVEQGEETLHFVLVICASRSSSLYWWNGSELALWKSLPDILGPHRLLVDTIKGETFLLVSNKKQLRIFHPTGTDFDLAQSLTFEQDIMSLDVREEPDEPPVLVLLTGSPSDPFVRVILIALEVKLSPVSASQKEGRDPLIQCLLDLEDQIQQRDLEIAEMKDVLKNMITTSEPGKVEEMSAAKVVLKLTTIDRLKVSPPGKNLAATATEIKARIESIDERISGLMNSQKSDGHRGYHVTGDVTVGRLKANRLNVKRLNKKPVNPERWLSLSKNQTISGQVRLDHLKTDVLDVSSINQIDIKDLLLRNAAVQYVTGNQTFYALKAGNVRFGEAGKINGILFSDLITSHNFQTTKIRGKKIFPRLKANQLTVNNINGVSFDKWVSKVLPKDVGQGEALNVSNLNVENLSVSAVNGIPWDDFVKKLYRLSENETITGNLRLSGATTVRNLETSKINGIPVKDLMTKTTSQTISNAIHVSKIHARSIKAKTVNNVTDSALVNILSDLPNPDPIRTEDDELEKLSFSGTTRLAGALSASHLVLMKTATLSGVEVDVDRLPERFWMNDVDQEINVPVTFKNGLTVTDSLQTKSINDLPVDSFARVDRPNTIHSKLVLKDAVVLGNVTFRPTSTKNPDLRLLDENTVKSVGENRISGEVTFSGRLSTSHLMTNAINDVDISNVPLRGMDPHFIDGKELTDLVVDGNVTSKALFIDRINGVNFDDVIKKAVMLDDPDVLQSGNYASIVAHNLDVDTINGLDVRDTMRAGQKEGPLDLVVEGNLHVQAINASFVNQVPFDDYISQVVLKNDSRVVKGHKTFEATATVTGNLQGLVNGYNTTELERRALSRTKSQNITGTLQVKTLNANNVTAALMDGVRLDRLIHQDVSILQTINSDVVFNNNITIHGNVDVFDLMDRCDLNAVNQVTFEKMEEFETLNVKGDLTWKNSRPELKGLSYLMKNAVTKRGNQVVSGPVVMQNDVVIETLKTKHHINDVDLGLITEDAVLQSLPNQKITRDVTFKGKVNCENIVILGDALVDNVNDFDIAGFNVSFVRNSEDVVVLGRKEFRSGFTASNLFAESINGLNTSKIVFWDDFQDNHETVLPPTTFRSLKVFNDLRVGEVDGINLHKLFSQRLSKSKAKVIKGDVTVKGDVHIQGGASVAKINDVNIKDTIMTEGEELTRVITGDVRFLESISVTHRLQVDKLNGNNVTKLHERALMTNQDAVIFGNVVFNEDIDVNGNIDVKFVNGCDMDDIAAMEESFNPNYVKTAKRIESEREVEKISNMTRNPKPVVFMHFEGVGSLDLKLSDVHASHLIEYKDVTEINVYGLNYEGECGLPATCGCPAQTNLDIRTVEPKDISVSKSSDRFFQFYDREIDIEVVVTTSTVSYSSRCKQDRLDPELTSISWRKREHNSSRFSYDESIDGGFLSDAKFFRLGDSVYVVLIFYFHPRRNDTNNVDMLIYELDSSKHSIAMVDNIPSTGAQMAEVFWTHKGITLVVGNTFDSALLTDNVDSAIYRFNELKNKFELLRKIKTHGVRSVRSVQYGKDSFIFFSQKQEWPLMILQYNYEFDNYHFIQRVHPAVSSVKSSSSTVAVLSTGEPGCDGDVFVGVVLCDDSFRLFKYKHIEGFVEILQQEENNVRVLQPFWSNHRQYMLVASASNSSKILRVVKQGHSAL